MTIRSQHRGQSLLLAALTVTLGLAGTVTPASAAQTATAGTPAKPTVVLVHGVFADSSGWNATITALQQAGFLVIAAADPLRDLAGDAAYVSSIVDTIPGPVIMVGHSYGGAASTSVRRRPARPADAPDGRHPAARQRRRPVRAQRRPADPRRPRRHPLRPPAKARSHSGRAPNLKIKSHDL
ncbi:alpha/beta fold hydrolase [Nonomuraea rubra]|uniref:alpha/beta fold hydrolase n=1 Tax=Nonomuraea rubra TaxID=46180 RepID=UPI0033F2D134